MLSDTPSLQPPPSQPTSFWAQLNSLGCVCSAVTLNPLGTSPLQAWQFTPSVYGAAVVCPQGDFPRGNTKSFTMTNQQTHTGVISGYSNQLLCFCIAHSPLDHRTRGTTSRVETSFCWVRLIQFIPKIPDILFVTWVMSWPLGTKGRHIWIKFV